MPKYCLDTQGFKGKNQAMDAPHPTLTKLEGNTQNSQVNLTNLRESRNPSLKR